MAARAIWQRSANRCFIREDAKRGPKLACCSSISSVFSEIDTKPYNLNEKSFDSDSKWWIQSKTGYVFEMGLTSEQVNVLESQNSHQFVENYDGSSINSSKGSYEFVEMAEKGDPGRFLSKKSIENRDVDRIMNTGLDLQTIKSGGSSISGDELQVVSSRTKILEALLHSQTRARKAELAAKKAMAEKDHVIKILFKQGSQLFAYKQWNYLLQLENLCYQIKNSNNIDPISPSKTGNSNKNLKKLAPAKEKRKRIKRWFGRFDLDLRKYAVAFVVGLGIVGAGLVLGWTVGWMLI